MFFLKKLHFQRSIYPIFYQNLEHTNENESAIIFMDVSAEILTIMVVINFKVVIFKKRIDSPLIIQNFTFSKELNNPTSELYELIKKTKHNASTIKSQHLIESFAELINKVKILYKISLDQQFNMWDEVFSLDIDFFNTNIPVTLPSGKENKWID